MPRPSLFVFLTSLSLPAWAASDCPQRYALGQPLVILNTKLAVKSRLAALPQMDEDIVLMTHFSNADGARGIERQHALDSTPLRSIC